MLERKTCLNCKFEPDWGEWTKGEYAHQSGMCKWDSAAIPTLPNVYVVSVKSIMRFKDDSGVQHYCKAWMPKT